MREGLLFNNNILIVPVALRSPFMSLLHETHPGQFGMKALAENIRWPHLYKLIFFHGKSCTQGLKAGKNLKVLLSSTNTRKLTELTKSIKKINLDFAGPLDKNWGTSKYLLLSIDRFPKFPSAKVVKNTSTNFFFVIDYCNLHGLSNSIKVDYGSCFLYTILKTSVRRSISTESYAPWIIDPMEFFTR